MVNPADAEAMKLILEHRNVARVLRILLDEGGSLPTVKLLDQLGGYKWGKDAIDEAERQHLIEREDREPEGKGNWLKINRLTEKGKRIARLAKELGV